MQGGVLLGPEDRFVGDAERELELLTCGEATVDLVALKKHTTYGATVSGGEREPQIKIFWDVLEMLNPEERRLFLTFTWGRNRLPLTDADWGSTTMKIHKLETPRPDQHFPVAHTCFFSLELPAYSSGAVCHDRLLYAITHCFAIDIDTTTAARENRDASFDDDNSD